MATKQDENNLVDLAKPVHQQMNQYRIQQIQAVLSLLNEGDTVPFIARYRKERTGALDEVAIRNIEDEAHRLMKLNQRRQDVINLVQEQGKLTPKLQQQLENATVLQQVEDLYLPYKQKRRTKATIAKEAGLEPLANWLLTFPKNGLDSKAKSFIAADKDLPDLTSVWAGVHEILVENFSENAKFREWIRGYTWQNGELTSKLKRGAKAKDEQQVYATYYEFSQALKQVPPYRVLAINRGEHEKILTVGIDLDTAAILKYGHSQLVGQKTGPAVVKIEDAFADAYKRFLGPAIERELRRKLSEEAQNHAIQVFGNNLYHLLMQAPLKGKVVMGFDPAYRTGCKLAIIDKNGRFLAKQVIYPHKPANAKQRAAAGPEFKKLLEKYHVEMIAIGNGTASRESEEFVSNILKKLNHPVYYVIVNEAGASVYSASANARAEFADLHVEERSAISIGRRLQDPLAELIKVDPKAIGVGQYQHDVSEKDLDEKLDRVVETAVNQVGVNLNTASPELLTHISGLTATTAKNIVKFRNENGAFSNRQSLKKVPRLGPKAYQQSVGFLRIISGSNPLDNTDIHPESYPAAKKLLIDVDSSASDIGTAKLQQQLSQLNKNEVAQQLEIGSETLTDIIAGLSKPGRDLRDSMPAPLLRQDVLTMADLKPGMELQGTVRNVVDFGAFVDIGVKQDGLVHISQLSDHFVSDPSTVVTIGDIVTVWVLEVDENRNRIQLTMRKGQQK
ncbi:Tex family protein [Companilactobacillus halodurans]|uniref:RNA-binding transcriptional accessory protein n=1 Tax=Companilactobacillus halodurans TaxID=2584183 RepID=A0A5P0ZUD1_9LACO|nr:Tex family protein [Companilactobacillus halodurans]MQS76089.1 RNA-binding transcriptional accessory protein [Companilactobacillus halodurans]MQS96525.1 RNA-binding transcriptional accessory protein [Companilactobacillus halodurans]